MNDTDLDEFDRIYTQERRLHRAWFSTVAASCAGCTALFAFMTSLETIRVAAVVIAAISVLLYSLTILGYKKEGAAAMPALRTGIITIIIGIGLSIVSLTTTGLQLGIESEISAEEAMANEAIRATDEETEDPEAAAIRALIDHAQENPSATSFRALVPYLDRDSTNIEFDGAMVSVSSAIRAVLRTDEQLYLRSLHEEAATMAALLPANNHVPELVSVRVAERLEFAVKNLIHAHSEKRIAGSFDVPSVGFNIHVSQMDEAGKPLLDENGEPIISDREIGITYAYANYTAGDFVNANPNTVIELINHIRKDLDY